MTAPIARLFLVSTMAAAGAHYLHGQDVFSPVIPHTWDEDALATLEVPLPNPEFSPKAVPADYSYRIPVRPVSPHGAVEASRHAAGAQCVSVAALVAVRKPVAIEEMSDEEARSARDARCRPARGSTNPSSL